VLLLCYMKRVGVRELRQNLSVYLQQVKEGDTLEVTERGVPVARLQPLHDEDPAIARLEREGVLLPGGTGRLDDLPPPRPLEPGEKTLTEVLLELREDER
jgi:prevent-host-death family protein